MVTQFPISKFQSLKTPFYYYDIPLLSKTIGTIKAATHKDTSFHIHYAVKANAHPNILQLIAKEGIGADCVSGGEVEVAINAGFTPEKIVFAGVGKSDDEIRFALENNIACFNVESLPELEVIHEIAQKLNKVAHIAFRVNPNVDAHTHEKITTGLHENKFGISPEQLVDAILKTKELSNVEYTGLHFHIGSQILNLEVYKTLCECINIIQDELEKTGIYTSSINVGGGLGIDYECPENQPIPDFANYFKIFREYLQLRPHQELHFELGRSIVAQCGSLITKVLYVKEGLAKKFVIVDAGMTDLLRPAMYGAHHQIQNITSTSQNENQFIYDVVGPVCESSDVFGTDECLPFTQRGDLLAIRSTGAYGETMASQYNQRPLPKGYTEL